MSPFRVRFGVFELDPRAGELCHNGESVRLQEKSLRVLQLLIEHKGELVTREEIQKKLWPNDTVVDFEHGINSAIKRLRTALGDSAENPKYIETLARRGYRLMAPVEWLESNADEAPSPEESDSSEGAVPPRELQPFSLTGRTVSHYRVLDIIGGGGMGVVYRAEDLKLGRRVALKFLPEELGSDPQALERFSREARAASSLDHPNICPIHEFGEHEGRPFIVMQLLEGQTLRDRLAADEPPKPMPLEELLDLGVQVSDGLQAAHERGIIHRDIKPANIFMTSKGVVKILDFGLAKLVEAPEEIWVERALRPASATRLSLPSRATRSSAAADDRGVEGPAFDSNHENAGPSTPRPPVPQRTRDGEERGRSAHDDSIKVVDATLTRTGAAMGTAGYMSPEQVRGKKLDARSDLFSFGLVLYQMATGQRAFAGETAEIVRDAIVHQPHAPVRDLNPKLPPKLERTINRALEKARERRYQSAAQMRADLEEVRSGKRAPARRLWTLAAAAALLAIIVVTGGLYWRSRNRPKLTDKDTIVLADFDNKTGDAIFDDTLRQGLSVQLEQSPFLDLISERKVNATLKLMGRSAGDRLTPEVTREVCQRTGSKALVTGLIAGSGSQYVIGLKAVTCDSGEMLAVAQEQAAGKEAVLKALGDVAVSLRSKLGESLGSVQQYATPLVEATTPSLEALKAYSLGRKTEYAKGDAAALPFYKRAVELDPNFAMAYRALSDAYGTLYAPEPSKEYARKAYELREKVSERERFFIEGNYYINTAGGMEKAAQTFELWKQTYPRDEAPYANLAFISFMLGNLEKALAESREALRLEPNSGRNYSNLGFAYAALNRLDEAESVYKQAEERKLGNERLMENRYQLAFVKGDTAQMEQLLSAAMGKPGMEGVLLASQADTEAFYGRLNNSRQLTQRAMESARRNDAQKTAEDYHGRQLVRELEFGHGEYIRLSGLVVEQFREAAVALENNNPQQAVELLKPKCAHMGTSNQYGIYLLGGAYLMLHDGSAAAAEFQKFIDQYGLVGNIPLAALARLGLARAYALDAAKDPAAREKARTAYQNFLILWKDADPDVPIYKQAKAEYAKLQ